MVKHIRIGEFANLCRLTIKALHHYDKLNLLKPTMVDKETGYRYYSKEQLKDANLICHLRSLNIPLKSIQEIFNHKCAQKFENILKNEIQNLNNQIEMSKMAINAINQLINQKEIYMDLDIQYKEISFEKTIFVNRQANLNDIGDIVKNAYELLCGFTAKNGIKLTGSPYILYLHQCDSRECTNCHIDMNMEIGLPVSSNNKTEGEIKAGNLEAKTYASCTHKGPYTQLYQIWQNFGTWVKENNYTITGSALEFYHNDPSVTKAEDLITELLLPIEK